MKPTVSVRLMTYNHEKFIAQAMDGIMMQQTDFDVEVVVGDDFSQDNTLDIIRSYKDKDKIHIRILERKVGDTYWKKRQKLGRLYNFTNIIENCRGEYIALLDGDDYWTDPLKLQKQVDYIERNKGSVLCFHEAKVIGTNGEDLKSRKFLLKPQKRKHSVEDLFNDWFIPSASVVFRNSALTTFPDWFYQIKNGDMSLYFLLAKKGTLDFIEGRMSVYRRHDGGVGVNISALELFTNLVYLYKCVNYYEYDNRLDNIIDETIEKLFVSMVPKNKEKPKAKDNCNSVEYLSSNIEFMKLLKALFRKLKNRVF